MEKLRLQSLYFQLKNGTPVLLKRFRLSKTCFKLLKSFKISTDYKKHADLSHVELYVFLYKQHFCKPRQTEISKKLSKSQATP